MSRPAPDVTFVLLTRDRRETLLGTLRRLAALPGGYASETLVIDNASSDGTCAAVKKEFPQVRLYRNSANLGAEARNAGVSEGRGKYVFMLDDDSWPLGDSVGRGLATLRRDPSAGGIAYRIAMSGGRFWTNGLRNSFAGCGALFDRAALRRAGGYPSGYGYYVEEYDVSFRLFAAGRRLLNFKDMLVYHAQAAAGRDTGRIIGLLTQNNVKLYSRFFPAGLAEVQIAHELRRYEVIARKEKVYDGYLAGLEASFGRLAESAGERGLRLGEPVCRSLLGLDVMRKRLRAFIKERRVKKPLFWGVGKAVHHFVDLARECGAEPAGIADPCAELYGGPVNGVPVLPQSGPGRGFDSVICGSSSLSANDDTEAQLRSCRAARGKPFLRSCDYDTEGA